MAGLVKMIGENIGQVQEERGSSIFNCRPLKISVVLEELTLLCCIKNGFKFQAQILVNNHSNQHV